MTAIHPGNMQARVGAVLAKIELQIEQTDAAGLSNVVQLLITYCWPYVEAGKDRRLALDAIKPFHEAANEAEAFQLDMDRVRVCLSLLREKNLFGYNEAPIGDSRALYVDTVEVTS